MTVKILTKENTQKVHEQITDKVFICAQGENESCAIIENIDQITSALIEEMKNLVKASIIKIIAKEADYKILKSPLEMNCDNIKYVNREIAYELFYIPGQNIIKASKTSVESQNIDGNAHHSFDTSETIQPIQKSIKVLIVDDSTTICTLLRKIMELSPQLEVVDTINDPLEAEAAIKKHSPDIITLDIHMPNMNGVELLKKIRANFQIPCIMISSISMQEGPLVLEALESGAVDYIQKPDMSNFATIASEINTKIIGASKSKYQNKKIQTKTSEISTQDIHLEQSLIVIGASTGGTKALKQLLDNLPSEVPPILIVQHIPAEFSRAFAERLNDTAKFLVKEATDGEEIKPNQVLIAPGGKQMKFIKKNDKMYVEVNNDAPVNRFKPSVDYLFDSVSNSDISLNIVAAIFTGMGRDGADGMKRLKFAKNAHTIAQNEESSVVFGMPKEAIKLGCVDHIVGLSDAAETIMDNCREMVIKKAQ